MKIETPLTIRQKVWIKAISCESIIVGFYWDANGLKYDCRWFINGEVKTGYLMEEEIQELQKDGTPPGFIRVEIPGHSSP